MDDRQDEQLRELAEKLDELESKVDQIAGRQQVLMALARGIDGKTDRLASIKTVLAIVLPVIGSILVALIGGYFVLKAGAPTVVK